MSAEERQRLAKKFGKAHGYKGRAGGWIYDSAGRVVCQGWLAFHTRYRKLIEAAQAEAARA